MLDSSRLIDCLSNYFVSMLSSVGVLYCTSICFFCIFHLRFILGCFVSYLKFFSALEFIVPDKAADKKGNLFILLLPVQSEIFCQSSPGSVP